MADNLKVLAQGQLSNSAGTIYDPTSGWDGVVKAVTLCNTDTSDHTFTLYINGTVAANEIRHNETIKAGKTYVVPETMFFGDSEGDTLKGVADVASKITYTVHGVETQ
jgi:hypothetical protein